MIGGRSTDFVHKITILPQVALIVAQSRDRKNRLSGIQLTGLSQGLKRVAMAAKKMKGSSSLKIVLTTKCAMNELTTFCEIKLNVLS